MNCIVLKYGGKLLKLFVRSSYLSSHLPYADLSWKNIPEPARSGVLFLVFQWAGYRVGKLSSGRVFEWAGYRVGGLSSGLLGAARCSPTLLPAAVIMDVLMFVML